MTEKENNNFIQPAVPKLDGYYEHWARLMENLLRSKDYWEVVENGVPALGNNPTSEHKKTVDEAKLKDLKAKNYLFQAIERGILETILEADTSKYLGSKKVKQAQLQVLRREFELLGMKEGETISDYFARTLVIANKMKSHGENMPQLVVVEKILRSLTPKYNYVVCSIVQANDIETLTIDGLQSSLVVEEVHMQGQKEEEQALKSASAGRGRGSTRGRGTGRGRGRQGSKEHLECYKCKKLGHFQYECPSLDDKIANYAGFDDEEEMMLMARGVDQDIEDLIAWFLDSGCSNHMCGVKKWFFELDEGYRETVKLGDHSRIKVMGKGSIRLKIQGRIQVITEVYYIPNLKDNLLSIGQLQQKGLKVMFDDDKCKIYHKEKGLIMTSNMSKNRMFVVMATPILPVCLQATGEGVTELWHRRFGHLGYNGLKLLQQKEMVKGLPELKECDSVCAECQIGKQHREAMPKQSSWRASRKLELVHSDICGPINPESNSKKR